MTISINDQIDYLVATKVMGYRATSANGSIGWSVPTSPTTGRVIWQSQWQPSTDIADAWQALTKFSYEEWFVSLTLDVDGWSCVIHKWSEEGANTRIFFADSAPMAICLAALKAVGAKVEREELTP